MPAGTIVIDAWQGTAKGATGSGVAQMQQVHEQGRSSMRGIRINEQEALCAACHASGSSSSYNGDFSDKFERVDAVFAYNKNTDAVVTDAQTQPQAFPATSRVVRGTVTGNIANGQNIVIGGLTIIPAANALATGVAATNATALVALINAAIAQIPGVSVVDNLNGTFDITFQPGTAPNGYATTSVSGNLTFAQTTAGLDSGSLKHRAKMLLTLTATDADVLLLTIVGKLLPSI